METLTSFITYAVALAIAVAIPGPGIAALVGRSLGGGLKPAMYFVGGMALGDVFYLSVAVSGLAAIMQLFEGAFMVIKTVGAAYLMYLAWKFWRSKSQIARVDDTRVRGGIKAFSTGFAISLGNPKVILFYLALLPTVLDLEAVGLLEWGILCILTLAVLFAALTPYVLLASRARGMMTDSGAIVRLNRLAAGVIGAAGLLILEQVARSLLRRA